MKFEKPLIVSGIGSVTIPPGGEIPDVTPVLKNRKMRKFMGKQDQLAVLAAVAAIQEGGVEPSVLKNRAGVYLCTGYIPFERRDIESIARNSEADGTFSPERFSTSGFEGVNPLLTFRCLPNMPIFHVSLNLEIHGPYFITYPGAGQFYLALEQASIALTEREVDVALVGAVADQNNFLVAHHHRRLPVANRIAFDAAGFLCLRRADAQGPILAEWLSYDISYEPMKMGDGEEFWNDESITQPDGYYGAASPAVLLHRAVQSGRRGDQKHELTATDGFRASGLWRL